MNIFLKTSAVVLAFAIAAPTMAATAVDMKTCDSLIKQYDTGVKTTKAAADQVTASHGLRASGEKECKAGNFTKGVDDLHAALADIGVK